MPIGICGSGVLDAVSEFLKYGVIDETGRMLNADEIENVCISSRVVVIDGMKQFLIEESGRIIILFILLKRMFERYNLQRQQ